MSLHDIPAVNGKQLYRGNGYYLPTPEKFAIVHRRAGLPPPEKCPLFDTFLWMTQRGVRICDEHTAILAGAEILAEFPHVRVAWVWATKRQKWFGYDRQGPFKDPRKTIHIGGGSMRYDRDLEPDQSPPALWWDWPNNIGFVCGLPENCTPRDGFAEPYRLGVEYELTESGCKQ